MSERLPEIGWVFALSSILSFGGANAIVPHLQEQTVATHHWLDDLQFVDCFAISQVTPGPNTLFATLLGYKAAGIAGAVLATLAITVPSAMLMYGVTVLWRRTGKARWHAALEHGLAPLGVGLVASAAVVVARGIDHGAGAWLVTVAALAALVATKVNPLLVVLAGGVAGLLIGL